MELKRPSEEFEATGVLIRRYRPADTDAVVDCWRRASAVGHPFLRAEELDEQQILIRTEYLPESESWVALADGRLVGFICLQEGFIGGLFVRPEAHRRGIGRGLVEHVAARRPRLTVEVYRDNPIATAFYRRCGFRPTGGGSFDDEGRRLELLARSRAR